MAEEAERSARQFEALGHHDLAMIMQGVASIARSRDINSFGSVPSMEQPRSTEIERALNILAFTQGVYDTRSLTLDTVQVAAVGRLLPGMLESISEQERRVIELRYGLVDGVGHTYSQIGKLFSFSGESVDRIKRHGLARLAHPTRRTPLDEIVLATNSVPLQGATFGDRHYFFRETARVERIDHLLARKR
jgi:hypothetical protein